MRIDEIESEFAGTVAVDWRSFLLRPKPEERRMESFTRYTESWARPAEMEPRATFNQWSGEHEPPSYSVPSAVAGKVAATFGPGARKAFSDAVFRAYFTENRTVSDIGVLIRLAGEAGLDATEFERRWEEGASGYSEAVFEDYFSAIEAEITGVPAVVVNKTWIIPGAVDTDHYRHIIARAQERLPPIWEIEAAIAEKAAQDGEE